MYLEADENLTGKGSHLTLFCLLSFFTFQLIPTISLGRIGVLYHLIISIPRPCFGHGVRHR